jgi:hypothetical protein
MSFVKIHQILQCPNWGIFISAKEFLHTVLEAVTCRQMLGLQDNLRSGKKASTKKVIKFEAFFHHSQFR